MIYKKMTYRHRVKLAVVSAMLLYALIACSIPISAYPPQHNAPRKTVGLETYINTTDGYSIKYPECAELSQKEENGHKQVTILGPKVLIRSWAPAYQLHIITHDNPEGLSAKEWARKQLLVKWREGDTFMGPVTADGAIDETAVVDIHVNGLVAYQERWEGEDCSVIHIHIANALRLRRDHTENRGGTKVHELIYKDYPLESYPLANVVEGIYHLMLSTFELVPMQERTNVVVEKKQDTDTVKVSHPKTKDDISEIQNSQLNSELRRGAMRERRLPRPNSEFRGVVLGTQVRVRDKPNLKDSKILFALDVGEMVEILDKTEKKESFSTIEGILLDGGYYWYKIKKKKTIGWTYGQFLYLGKPPVGVSAIRCDFFSNSVWYSKSFANSTAGGMKDATKYYLPLHEWSYHGTYIPLKYDICAYLFNNTSKSARNLRVELKVYYLLGAMTDDLSVSKGAKWVGPIHTFNKKITSLAPHQLTRIFFKGIDFENDYDKLISSDNGWLWKVKIEAQVHGATIQSKPHQSEIMIIHGN